MRSQIRQNQKMTQQLLINITLLTISKHICISSHFQFYYLAAPTLQTSPYLTSISNLYNLSHFICMDSSPQLANRIQPSPSPPARSLIILKRIGHAKTDKPESSSMDMSPTDHRRKIPGIFQRGSDFPSIFGKHKRSSYSGYKQYNMNKSKIIKFQQDNKDLHPYQTPRQFEINLKNIAKLRKRFSLEPMVFRKSREDSVCRSTIFQPKHEQIGSERRHEQQLREIMKDIGKEQTNTERTFIIANKDATRESVLYRSKNRSEFERYELEEESPERKRQNERAIVDSQALPVTFQKPYYVQLKRRVENKLQKGRLDRQKVSDTESPPVEPKKKQEELDLCGWSNQSFYPKKAKAKFFHQYGQQLQLVAGPT